MILNWMLFKGYGEMAIIITAINAHVYIEIVDNFLIPAIENRFGDNEIIFQDDNASCHMVKFLFRKGI